MSATRPGDQKPSRRGLWTVLAIIALVLLLGLPILFTLNNPLKSGPTITPTSINLTKIASPTASKQINRLQLNVPTKVKCGKQLIIDFLAQILTNNCANPKNHIVSFERGGHDYVPPLVPNASGPDKWIIYGDDGATYALFDRIVAADDEYTLEFEQSTTKAFIPCQATIFFFFGDGTTTGVWDDCATGKVRSIPGSAGTIRSIQDAKCGGTWDFGSGRVITITCTPDSKGVNVAVLQ